MKGLASLFLGIFGTFAFSWVGLTVIPNWQIGHLDPQMDEEGTDVYPAPKSGMAERGRQVYIANGCFYCHSQQVRADYAASDIDRKWGERRSAPRDYVFERPVLIGKTRMGPDLANVGKRTPAEEVPTPSPAAALAGAAPPAAAPPPPPPAGPAGSPTPGPSPAASPEASPAAPAAPASPPPATSTSPAAAPPAASPEASPAAPAAPGSPPPATSTSPPAAPPVSPTPTPAASPAAPGAPPPPAASPSPTAALAGPAGVSIESEPKTGEPPTYSAAWHHRHLYSPRSITIDSNMPAYRFLYHKRRVAGERSADAVKLIGRDAPPYGWEIVPTYEAKCLVAYLMSLDQSHPLKEVKSGAPQAAPAASPAPPGAPPAPAAAPSPPK